MSVACRASHTGFLASVDATCAEVAPGTPGAGAAKRSFPGRSMKQKKNPAFVYNSMSDGELDEGSTWEAAMSAAHHRLDNLICLVDINNQQADGSLTIPAVLQPYMGGLSVLSAA